MKCQCCDTILDPKKKTKTCSVECGMIYRYYKKFEYSREKILEILQYISGIPETNDKTVNYHHKLYLNKLTECPKCKICSATIPNIKDGIIKETCSAKCSKELTKRNLQAAESKLETKTCPICFKEHKSKTSGFCSIKCSKIHQGITPYLGNTTIEDIHNFKHKQFTFSDRAIFLSNGIKDMYSCDLCGNEMMEVRNYKIATTCSTECANNSKFTKNKDELNLFKEFSLEVRNTNPQLNLTHTNCVSLYRGNAEILNCKLCMTPFLSSRGSNVKHCSGKCASLTNVKNLENLHSEYVKENFIGTKDRKVFKIQEFMDYFNISYSTSLKYKVEFNIDEPNIDTQQNSLYNLLPFTEDRIQNCRNTIRPKEIDIMYPNKFGIEYNGLMWHSSGLSNSSLFNKTDKEMSNTHLFKTEACEEKGIQLFHIFENEFMDPKLREIWLSVINNKLNLNNKIYARKTIVKEVNSKEAKEFIDLNHLQGNCNASVRIGLYHNEELVSIMTFGKSRYNKEVEYELIRFCSKLNTVIVGGASKLLKYFEANYKPKSLLSYANRRWSQGGVYLNLGFTFIKKTQPNYFYFKSNNINELYSRQQFQKHKLKDKLEIFDLNKTETENMYINNYRKIYDSGNLIYIKTYK